MHPRVYLIALFMALNMIIFGQTETSETEKNPLENGTLDEQFEYVIEKSNRYQDYKVVRQAWLEKLRASAADSMKAVQKELKSTQETVKTQQTEIKNLNFRLESLNDSLSTVNNEKNSIDFLGAPMHKSAYKTTMWSILGLLLALLLFFIYKFKNSNVLTVEAQKNLAEVQLEFENFKKNAREKEQKLKRELQDEINKRL